MPNTLNATNATVSIESLYAEPQFDTFRDTPALLRRLYGELREHGPQLHNMKIERGTSQSFGELHVVSYLYNSRAGVRVYADKVSLVWINMLNNEIDKFWSVYASAVAAVKSHQPLTEFRSHVTNVTVHGTIEGQAVTEYLADFITNVRDRDSLGPRSGNGYAIYFGPSEDRLLWTFTVDLSTEVSGGVFVRHYVVWDGSKVGIAALPRRATDFLRQVLSAVSLEMRSLPVL